MASSQHHHHQHCHCHDGVCVGAHMMGPATGEGGVAATESRDHSQTSARCSTTVAPPKCCSTNAAPPMLLHPPTFTCLISSLIVMPTNQRLAIPIRFLYNINHCNHHPNWQVWPRLFFLAHLFLLSSHCFERGFDPCQIGAAACCSPIQPTSESNFAFVCQCE